jgi:hypothetical protein
MLLFSTLDIVWSLLSILYYIRPLSNHAARNYWTPQQPSGYWQAPLHLHWSYHKYSVNYMLLFQIQFPKQSVFSVLFRISDDGQKIIPLTVIKNCILLIMRFIYGFFQHKKRIQELQTQSTRIFQSNKLVRSVLFQYSFLFINNWWPNWLGTSCHYTLVYWSSIHICF